uniref:protein DA1-related 7-like isoform X1 n=1 Tax=Fragaria vesca subsp. vesca TaxID=101020 RepID=UPI0005C8D460|nr:PREDICTED: protein DA1-related 7-like isoform X1 [Fragaria vesca subsp. vesca]
MSPNDDSEEVKHDSYMASIFRPDCDTCFRSKIEKCSRSGGDTKKVVKFVLGRAILLLFGLPDVEMGEILAHEMMHAWIHLQGVPRGCCEPSTEEGICQLMSYKWLQWFSSSRCRC